MLHHPLPANIDDVSQSRSILETAYSQADAELMRFFGAQVNTLGYKFYGDCTYHLSFSFAHSGATLILDFSSSLFEGKGIEDESWGLDNVRVSTDAGDLKQ